MDADLCRIRPEQCCFLEDFWLDYELEALGESHAVGIDTDRWLRQFASHATRQSVKAAAEALHQTATSDAYIDKLYEISDVYETAYENWVADTMAEVDRGEYGNLSVLLYCALNAMNGILHLPDAFAEHVWHELIWVKSPHKPQSWIRGVNYRITVDSMIRGPGKHECWPTKKYIRRLRSKDYIKRCLRTAPKGRSLSLMMHVAKRTLRRFKKIVRHPFAYSMMRYALPMFNDNSEAVSVEKHRDMDARRTRMLEQYERTIPDHEWPEHLRKRSPKLLRKQRTSLKRSIAQVEKFMGREAAVRANQCAPFNFKIDDEYSLKVRITNMRSLTYSATNRVVYHTPTNKQVAEVCVYFEDTPAPEQLLGFWINSQAGTLADVLTAANTHQIYDVVQWDDFRKKYPFRLPEGPTAERLAENAAPLLEAWGTDRHQGCQAEWRRYRDIVTPVIREAIIELFGARMRGFLVRNAVHQ